MTAQKLSPRDSDRKSAFLAKPDTDPPKGYNENTKTTVQIFISHFAFAKKALHFALLDFLDSKFIVLQKYQMLD